MESLPILLHRKKLILAIFATMGLILNPVILALEIPADTSEEKSTDYLIDQELKWLRAEAFISIPTGISELIHRAPAIATVITAADIEAMGITELDEALETVPGLHVLRNGFQGYGSIYAIRGIYSDFNPEVLLLINGIPVTSSLFGGRGPLWKGLTVNNIARIEVIRGPGSAVYGANAFAGVINVITKTSEEIAGTEAGARVGRFDTQEYWALHGGKWGGFDVALALEYFTTDGQREEIDADFQTVLDGISGNPPASRAPGPVSLGVDRFDARVDISRGVWGLRLGYQGRYNVGNGVGAAQTLDQDADFEYDRINADLTYHDPKFTDHWDVTAQASFLDTGFEVENDQTFFPAGSTGGVPPSPDPADPPPPILPEGLIVNPGTTEHHLRFNLSGIYSGYDSHLIRTGAGIHYVDLREVSHVTNIDPATGPLAVGQRISLSDTPFAFQPEVDRTDWHAFLQDSWTFTLDWALTSGLRYDHYSDFGSTVNPRIALVWQTQPSLTSKFLYGRAFRAPSLLDSTVTNIATGMGNPNIDPETIDTVELGFDYQATDDLHLALNLFHYWIDDKIQLIGDGALLTAQNVGEQTGRGLELETRWKASRKIDILANYAYQDATDEKLDRDAGNVPHHQLFLRADWRFLPKWHFNARVNFVADRDRVTGDTRPDIDDYTTVDLTLRHKGFADHWDFAVSVRNLFDEDAREPSGGPGPATAMTEAIPNDLPLAGRSYFAEIRCHF